MTSRYGNSTDTLDFAISRLSGDSVKFLQTSPFYATPAFPKGSGPDFVNAVAAIETTLSASELMAFLHEIEEMADRSRLNRWAARTLDLDIISFGGVILPDREIHEKWVNLPLEDQIKSAPKELIVPHPRVQDRSFVLIPLRDVAPDWVHPVTNLPIDTLIDALPKDDIASVRPLNP